MKTIACLWLLLFSGALLAADPATRLATLEAAHQRAHLEQQAVYQQFMMAQALHRNAEQALANQGMVRPRFYPEAGAAPPLDYDEQQRLRRQLEARLQAYERDIATAYARYVTLGQQKEMLLEQIIELAKTAASTR